jgi:DNA topoisomerase-1
MATAKTSPNTQKLVIVESPAKGKTIEGFLGKDFKVMASFGHIRDLPKSGMSLDIAGGTFEPNYEISPDKKKRINELKSEVKKSAEVYLASDEDREGEAISWHLTQALGLDPKTTKRIVFHEITKGAIQKAMETPRVIDQGLVDAQQARRVLDRLVGYELSPVLWKKVQPGLSAGRVQSVAVRVIVEREREIDGFTTNSSYKVTALFNVDGAELKAELPRRFASEEEAHDFLSDGAKANYVVADLEKKPGKRTPAAPFTTSTLQQEASRKLGFSVKQTMTIAQRLYESGHITYMRTDSVNLSETAIAAAAAAIKSSFGEKYYQMRTFKTKSAGAQEAHEAIRPTHFENPTISGEPGQMRLYELIWKRTVASQMAEAVLERTKIEVKLSNRSERLNATGEVVVFDGFLKLYIVSTDDDAETDSEDTGLLPKVEIGQPLELKDLRAVQTYDRPKPRYTEASLVKALEEMGIGRPSTYAPTISTVQDRGYVEKVDIEAKQRPVTVLQIENGEVVRKETEENFGADRGKLVPTDVGMLVSDFLVKYFPNVVDFQFTAKVEEEFDEIADGKKQWNKMIAEFYGPFHETVEAAGGISRQEAAQAREIGTDPKTGKMIIARLGRFGPMLQLGLADEQEEKPKFAPIPPGKRMDDVTLEEALELFKLPRIVGQTKDGQDIAANLGRFGPYIKWGSLYQSIKPDDPLSLTYERALKLIAEKEKSEAEKYIKRFEGSEIVILNGRYGPFISDGKKNAKIPKGTEPADVTFEQAKTLIAEAPVRSKRKRIVRKS